jgi:hypothetical protein
LKKSPFFTEEHMTLKLSMQEGATRDQVNAHLPDPVVLNGLLVPFRRLWQQSEPCHFARVSNILKKYSPFVRAFMEPLELNKGDDAVNLFPAWPNEKLSYQDLINVWLNTRYHHVGSSAKAGSFARKDFERMESQIGPVLFEYYFVFALWKFGIYFFNLKPFAEGFISDVSQRGCEPSFSMRSSTPEGSIRRTTPGFSTENDSTTHRVWCLRRRRAFAAFNSFLSIVGLSDQYAADLILQYDAFEQFALGSVIKLTLQTELELPEQNEFTHLSCVIDEHLTAVLNRKCRKGFIGQKSDYSLVLAGDALPIISEQYASFRAELQKSTFS